MHNLFKLYLIENQKNVEIQTEIYSACITLKGIISKAASFGKFVRERPFSQKKMSKQFIDRYRWLLTRKIRSTFTQDERNLCKNWNKRLISTHRISHFQVWHLSKCTQREIGWMMGWEANTLYLESRAAKSIKIFNVPFLTTSHFTLRFSLRNRHTCVQTYWKRLRYHFTAAFEANIKV